MNYISATGAADGLLFAQGPSHARSIVSDAKAAVGTKQDDAAMALETRVEIRDGVLGGLFRPPQRRPVDSPFAQHQLHDRFAPSGKRRGRTAVVGVAAAADQGRVAYPAGGFVQSPAGGSGGGQVAGGVQGHRAHGVMRKRWGSPARWSGSRPCARACAACRRCRSRSSTRLAVIDQRYPCCRANSLRPHRQGRHGGCVRAPGEPPG